MSSPPSSLTIPVLLLKTRSQPHDAYEEYFSGSLSATTSDGRVISTDGSTTVFLPEFVPVLEHRPNTENLTQLEQLLASGGLAGRYGGMIFTSQRAVEAWGDVVRRIEQKQGQMNTEQNETRESRDMGSGVRDTSGALDGADAFHPPLLDEDFSFPLYTVGPATSRALRTLVTDSSSLADSPFIRLRPAIYGAHTGNGDALAQYILHNYNTLHSQLVYTFYEAPRLPFTPLIGPPYGERLEKHAERLQKKPLLFLVGEQRRDIIPRTLMDTGKEQNLPPEEKIQVDEVEVYVTATMSSFQDYFQKRVSSLMDQGNRLIVVVVFSPQGCEAMLRSLGYIDEDNMLTDLARRRWEESNNAFDTREEGVRQQRYIIATIGPTTRDHLKNQYGFDADICAARPSPEGVGTAIAAFLKEKGLV